MTSIRRFVYLLVVLACLLEGCKPENISIPLNADPKNPGSASSPQPATSQHQATDADQDEAEGPQLAPPIAQPSTTSIATQTDLSFLKQAPRSTPTWGFVVDTTANTPPPAQKQEEQEELETKAGEDVLKAAKREVGNIQHHYETAKKKDAQHQLTKEQVQALQGYHAALASHASSEAPALQARITQLLVQGGPAALRRPSLVAANQLRTQSSIANTQELVEALNKAQEPDKHHLCRWLQEYITWFTQQPIEHLGLEDRYEYSALAEIEPKTPAQTQLLLKYFHSLCNRVQQGQYGEESLMQALERTLQTINPAVFAGNPKPLHDLAQDLLNKLTPQNNSFTEATYPAYQSTLYSLYQTLALIHRIAPNQ